MIQSNYFIYKIYLFGAYVFAAAVWFVILQLPFIKTEILDTFPGTVINFQARQTIPASEVPLLDTFFGEEAYTPKAQKMIEKHINHIGSRWGFGASLAVIEKYETTIKKEAAKNGVPEDVALGVGLLENGGSTTAVSSAGAMGVYQLMPGTARSLGLTVNNSFDERKNPEKNIKAGMRYLGDNYERFGDWGLATWAYHAGGGNVSKALKIYAKANHNVNLSNSNEASVRAYIKKHDITIHKLLSDPSVKPFAKSLKDDSIGYPYKVVATATLYQESR